MLRRLIQPPLLPLLIAGIVFLGFGTTFAFLFPADSAERADRLEALVPKSVTQLSDTPANDDVFIEGVISADNLTVYDAYVAYKSEKCTTDSEGDTECELIERATPPLVIQVPDGVVQVINNTYTLGGSFSVYREGDLDYIGFVAGDTVILEGVVLPHQALE